MGAETVLLECPQSAVRSDVSTPELRDGSGAVTPSLFDWGKEQTTRHQTSNNDYFLEDLKSAHHTTGRFTDFFDVQDKCASEATMADYLTRPTNRLSLFDEEKPAQPINLGVAAESATPAVSEGLNLDIELSRSLSPSTHVAVTTVHYPYSIDHPYSVLEACECPNCVSLINSQISYAPMPLQQLKATLNNFVTYDEVKPRQEPTMPSAPTPAVPPALLSSMAGRSILESRRPYTTPFMPPPPPPSVSRTLLAEEGIDAAAMFRRMLFRWYAKLQKVQLMWTGAVEVCPAPPTSESEFALEQWSQMAACWWNAHFAHLQKRHKPYYYTRYR